MFTMGPALLFVPADRPDRFAKAAERSDAVIVDLEDSVAYDHKPAARAEVGRCDLDPERTIVRVNAASSGLLESDLSVLVRSSFRTVMLPKAEEVGDVAKLASFDVVALCETARGVMNAEHLAAEPNVVALMWGAEDLMASMGGHASRTDTGAYRDIPTHARARVALAAAYAGKDMIDAVHLNLDDDAGLRAEALDAAAQGFVATACIHPAQVATVREAYAPTAERIAWAEGLLAASADHGHGVFRYEGQMIDEPVLRHARSILSRKESR